MKSLLVLLALATSTAFAGSFVKIDKGTAQWSMESKKKAGQITLTRHSSGAEAEQLSLDEQIKVMNVLGWITSLGTIAIEPTTFETSDERSQETVTKLIEKKMIAEMVKLEVDVKNVDITLDNVSCKESGLFKKKLDCSASYESNILVEFR